MTTKRGAARTVQLDGERAIVVGGGPADEVDADALRDAAAAVVNELRVHRRIDRLAARRLAAAVPGGAGARSSKAQFSVTTTPAHGRPRLARRRTFRSSSSSPRATSKRLRAVRKRQHGGRTARASSTGPRTTTPASFAEYAAELAADKPGLSAEALGLDAMRELGMGALLGVGAGSYNEPRLIVLRWEPPQAAGGDLVLGLVGKGLTFDSGGISLKPATHMEDMKGDMAGAAAVVAGIGALAELAVPVRAMAVVAAAENMPSGRGMRPGDILTAANGKTIEVTNTDAEGRLVLADALWYAREQGATHVVDFATLTGIMRARSATCTPACSPTMSSWRDEIVAAGNASGDYVWPFPLHPRYRRIIDSAFADMKNSSLRPVGGPIYATSFLEEFAGEGPWAHIDMADGPAHVVARRLPVPGRRHGLGRAPDRRAGRAPGGRYVNFELAEEHELIRRTVRDFAEQRVAPVAEELDREHRFPYELVEELAGLGLMGLPSPSSGEARAATRSRTRSRSRSWRVSTHPSASRSPRTRRSAPCRSSSSARRSRSRRGCPISLLAGSSPRSG